MLGEWESAFGPTGSSDCAPRVCLAGSIVSFSDRILSLLRKEFPEFDFQRVDEASLGDGEPVGGVHLLVCEEGPAARALVPAALGRVPVAVAFSDAQSIAAWLTELDPDGFPPGLSLLPMNLRFEAWLSIMRLLLFRETFVPVNVFRQLHEFREDRSPSLRQAMAGAEPPLRAGPRRDLVPVLRKLTDRERKVLPLVAQGKQNKVIAEELAMSEHTVKLHVHHIIGKLGVRNRTEVARYYLSQPASVEGA